jgi:ornithine cyclodeaminase/alanine dehydrogenase
MTRDTLVLTARDVARSLDLARCIEAVEQGLRLHEEGRSQGPASLGLTLPDGSFHVKAAGLSIDGRSFIAAKSNVNLPGNPARCGLPTIQGVLTLADADTGFPLAVMDSALVTSIRTAAATAVAARRLALPGSNTVTVVGCGEQGEVQLRAVAAVCPVRRVFALDLDRDKARAYARRLSGELGIVVESAMDVGAALRQSAIGLTCTTSTSPIVHPDDVHPGLLVAAIGADNPHKQELDPRILASARVVVDSLAACATGGELHHAIDAGLMTADDVHGELSALVAGRRPGRSSPDEVFVFDSTGSALMDVAAAVLVYASALTAGRGVAVALGTR